VTAKPKGCYPGPRPGGFLGIEPKATVTTVLLGGFNVKKISVLAGPKTRFSFF